MLGVTVHCHPGKILVGSCLNGVADTSMYTSCEMGALGIFWHPMATATLHNAHFGQVPPDTLKGLVKKEQSPD